uniref:Secreted protein n=1 Tax=Helianthus annuus TaxID=4232 RepID=A0A251S670_HELAN
MFAGAGLTFCLCFCLKGKSLTEVQVARAYSVRCVGGFLQIELLSRVQVEATDGKCSICAEFSESSNGMSLKYDAKEFRLAMRNVSSVILCLVHDFLQMVHAHGVG